MCWAYSGKTEIDSLRARMVVFFCVVLVVMHQKMIMETDHIEFRFVMFSRDMLLQILNSESQGRGTGNFEDIFQKKKGNAAAAQGKLGTAPHRREQWQLGCTLQS